MTKKTGFWISIVFLVLAIVSLLLYFHKKNTDLFAEKIITKTSLDFKKDLRSFLNNVQSITKGVKEDVSKVDVDSVSRKQLLNYFTKLISRDDLLKGIILLGHKRNFVLIRNNNSWVVTHSPLKDTLINWQRLDNQLKPVSDWTDLYNYFMELSDLDSIKSAYLKDGTNVWRTAKSKIPEYRDLLFNIFKTKNAAGVENITLLIYKAGELENRFIHVLSFKEPLVTLITKNNHEITPIRTKDTTLISKYDALTIDVSKIINTWQTKQNEQPHLYPFHKFDRQYWTRIDTINEQKVGVKAYALTIANDDLLETALAKEDIYLYISLTFLLFALYIFLMTYRRHKKSLRPPGASLDQMTNEGIKEILKKGETDRVEFKSSLRWDYREEKVNKALEDVILKSVAAFSNAKGGKLFIGINDDMEILGLAPDFNTLKKQNADYFELHLRKLINNQYGIKFSSNHLHLQFPVIDDKTICIIHIIPSDSPLYVKVKNNQGRMVEKFYVRLGNASQEITSLQEMQDYIKSRFE